MSLVPRGSIRGMQWLAIDVDVATSDNKILPGAL